MIRITKRTDYAIVLLSTMTAVPDQRFNAPELAEESQLPLPMVSKVLKELARAGLLVSQRGVHGGYALARDPREISIGAVITALEGPIAVTECIDDAPGVCDKEAFCPVSSNWGRINLAIRDALGAISLAEMAPPPSRLVTLGGRIASEPTSTAAGAAAS